MAVRSIHPKAVARPVVDYTDRTYWNGIIKMSLSKFFVLCVLHQKPMHGYEVVQAVERTTNGCCSPTEGTVYPMLNEFEAGGYLTAHGEVVQGRERKVYTLTRKGRDAFRTAVAAWMEATGCIMASRAASEAIARSQGAAQGAARGGAQGKARARGARDKRTERKAKGGGPACDCD